ncbi:MAG: hypothetical protein EXR95_09705 [Gemmatimonadetes bacterium]|nr:hypothetical protein [Gemmatimonadota bacterium]
MALQRIGLGLTLIATAVVAACGGETKAATASRLSMDPASKGGDDRNGPYDVVPGWWKAAPEHDSVWTWGSASGVWADTPDRILVVMWGDERRERLPATQGQRGPVGRDNPNEKQRNFFLVVDRSGNIIENWSQWDTLFNRPHQVYVNPYDPERSIWVDERGGEGVHEAIYKFSNDGKQLLMKLVDPRPVQGESDAQGVVPPARDNPKPGPYDFGQNAVLAFLPNGDFLLGDGYQNGRIVRYNSKGELLREFGSVGSGPGQFDLVHGIAVDKDSRIYVSDRMNHRIQIFTDTGELVDTWPDIWDPVAIMVDVNNNVWILDATLNRVLKYDTAGHLLDYFGTYGEASSLGRPGFTCSNEDARTAAGVADFHQGACGGMSLPHQMHVDSEGNVYIAQFGGPWIDKYVAKAGADATRLIGQPLKLQP